MKNETQSIAESLPTLELKVLCAFATDSVEDWLSAREWAFPRRRGEWAEATQSLINRGMLARTKKKEIVVTPEGLALALDSLPIDVVTTATPLT